MPQRVIRSLTSLERNSLSDGLWRALRAAGACPRIVATSSSLARLSSLWRGHTPVLTLGDRIYWSRAPEDCTVSPAAMALLQHELQHVLDFATGRLSPLGYAVHPGNWVYRLPPPERWDWSRLGAEQRAMLTEMLWRAERAGDVSQLRRLTAIIPWAAEI